MSLIMHFFSDECKMLGEAQSSQANLALQPPLAEPTNNFDIGFNQQPMVKPLKTTLFVILLLFYFCWV